MSQVLGELRTLAQAIVIWTRPLSDAPAATDGAGRIWIDPRVTQIEDRCFTTHEMVHMRRGHTGCQPPAVERSVCLETARILVPFEALAKHAGWARSMAELAEELSVTEEVLIDRFQTLDGDQLQALWPNEHHIA
ncbi:ImmA/IrrE family metallo-endopeptidase [Paeniglutamicibacter sp. R2-26]|uniref:ImmA/IrrE family metallo-endopeptidase n=1 Tax=Paeniglutamicibacter sp. R2-26 TaxID=3144417 RepID=UPI003EE54138